MHRAEGALLTVRGAVHRLTFNRVADRRERVAAPALRGAARELNVLRWVTAVGLTVVASLIGAAAVANDNAWGIWAVAMVVMGEALVAFQLPRRRVRVIRRLLSELS